MASRTIPIGLILASLAVGSLSSVAQSLDLPESVLTSLEQGWSGSGVIVSSDGYLLTNNHVIEEATTIQVVLASGQSYEATVIEAEPGLDLALIKINASGLPSIPVDDDRLMKQGYSVVSIGSPKGLVGTLSTGIITALNRNALGLEDLYQTDANIAPGSSGGPLIDEYGNLIGINVAVAQESGVSLTAFGFAIPIEQAEGLLGRVGTRPSSRSKALTVPEIAEACSPATAYIVCKRDVPLISFLPDELEGFKEAERYEATLDELEEMRLDCTSTIANLRTSGHTILPLSIILAHCHYFVCEWRAARQLAVTFQDQEASSVAGDLFSYVAIMEAEDLEDARRIADAQRQCEMKEHVVISRGTYTSGTLVADWELGWHELVSPTSTSMEKTRTTALTNVATLCFDDFLLVAQVQWQSSTYKVSLNSPHDADYEVQHGCVVRTIRRSDSDGNTAEIVEQTELICLDEFQQQAQWVFEQALAALSAAF